MVKDGRKNELKKKERRTERKKEFSGKGGKENKKGKKKIFCWL